MLKYYTIIGIVFAIILSGCAKKSNAELLAEANEVIRTNLDSAKTILEKIHHPELLVDSLRYSYNRISAIYLTIRTGHLHKADSFNNAVLDHCFKVNDTVKLKEALYFSGRINLNNGNPDKALESFFRYREISEKQQSIRNINAACFYISNVYLNMQDHKKALLYAKESLNYSDGQSDDRYIEDYKYIASIYKRMNDIDSAMCYYKKSLDIIKEKPEYNNRISSIFVEMSELELNNNHYKEALNYVNIGIWNRTSRKDVSFLNLTKAKVFIATNQTDSAQIYLRRAIESSDDDFISIMAYDYLANLYKDVGNYEQAFFRQLNMNELFENKTRALNSEMMTQKYQEEKLKNENNELQLIKREQEILFLSVVLISVIIIVVLFFFLLSERRKKKIREHVVHIEAMKTKALMMENENKLLRQENELVVLREKSAILRESLFRKMSVATKIPSLNTTNDDIHATSSGKIDMKEPDWNELINTVDDLFGGFVSSLSSDFPALSKEDIGFCCLLKINVSMQDMADIYCISKAGITKKKTRMKKDKFNIHEEGRSLDDFLASY
jgi:Tfp pilus assembly protein PilF